VTGSRGARRGNSRQGLVLLPAVEACLSGQLYDAIFGLDFFAIEICSARILNSVFSPSVTFLI
jgi:hypothetical protein